MNTFSDVQDFVDQFPGPPQRARGDVKRTISVVLTEPEARVVAKIAASEGFRSLYNGHQSEVLRYAFYYLCYWLEAMVDMDMVPELPRLMQRFEQAAMIANKDAIVKYLDLRGTQLNLLLDYGELDGALTEYDELLDEIAQHRPHWRKVFHHMMGDHEEVQRFIKRVEARSFEDAMALKGIEEKPR